MGKSLAEITNDPFRANIKETLDYAKEQIPDTSKMLIIYMNDDEDVSVINCGMKRSELFYCCEVAKN